MTELMLLTELTVVNMQAATEVMELAELIELTAVDVEVETHPLHNQSSKVTEVTVVNVEAATVADAEVESLSLYSRSAEMMEVMAVATDLMQLMKLTVVVEAATGDVGAGAVDGIDGGRHGGGDASTADRQR